MVKIHLNAGLVEIARISNANTPTLKGETLMQNRSRLLLASLAKGALGQIARSHTLLADL
jgi:hypothetical protein